MMRSAPGMFLNKRVDHRTEHFFIDAFVRYEADSYSVWLAGFMSIATLFVPLKRQLTD